LSSGDPSQKENPSGECDEDKNPDDDQEEMIVASSRLIGGNASSLGVAHIRIRTDQAMIDRRQ
jgi:hypothetical protein